MPLDINEAVKDGLGLMQLIASTETALQAMPENPVLVDYAKALKIPPESQVYQLLALIDAIRGDIKS